MSDFEKLSKQLQRKLYEALKEEKDQYGYVNAPHSREFDLLNELGFFWDYNVYYDQTCSFTFSEKALTYRREKRLHVIKAISKTLVTVLRGVRA